MVKHKKVYCNYFGYTDADWIPCENCGATAVDIHHLEGRGKGKDVIELLMALCRTCHDEAHNSTPEFNEKLKLVHQNRLK